MSPSLNQTREDTVDQPHDVATPNTALEPLTDDEDSLNEFHSSSEVNSYLNVQYRPPPLKAFNREERKIRRRNSKAYNVFSDACYTYISLIKSRDPSSGPNKTLESRIYDADQEVIRSSKTWFKSQGAEERKLKYEDLEYFATTVKEHRIRAADTKVSESKPDSLVQGEYKDNKTPSQNIFSGGMKTLMNGVSKVFSLDSSYT